MLIVNRCTSGRSAFATCASADDGRRGFNPVGSASDRICAARTSGGRCSSTRDSRGTAYTGGDIALSPYSTLGPVSSSFGEVFAGPLPCHLLFDGTVVSTPKELMGRGRGMLKSKRCGARMVMSTRGRVTVERGIVASEGERWEDKYKRDEIGGKHGRGWARKEVGLDKSRGVLKERGGKECKSLCNR